MIYDHFFTIVASHPRRLSSLPQSVQRKILNRTYRSVDDFERDIILMVNNAKTFNEPGSAVHQDAIEILVGGALSDALADIERR